MNLAFLSILNIILLSLSRHVFVVNGFLNRKVCPDVPSMKNFNIKKVREFELNKNIKVRIRSSDDPLSE